MKRPCMQSGPSELSGDVSHGIRILRVGRDVDFSDKLPHYAWYKNSAQSLEAPPEAEALAKPQKKTKHE